MTGFRHLLIIVSGVRITDPYLRVNSMQYLVTEFRALASAAVLVASLAGGWSAFSAGLDTEAISERNAKAVVVTLGTRATSNSVIQGSGCAVHISGLVLTTAHQVANMESLRVRLNDGSGREVSAYVVVADESLDTALIRTETPLPYAVTLGDASRLKMGSPLLAITSPMGLDFSAVDGIVSSTKRVYRGHPVIHTNLPASPGSSGGPVFDEAGLLVGFVMGAIPEADQATLVNPINNLFELLEAHGVSLSEGPLIDPDAPPTPGPRRSSEAIEHYNRGVSGGTAAEKEAAYTEAVSLSPEFFEAWFNLGVVNTELGDLEGAIAAYEEAGQLRPDAAEVFRNLGRVLLRHDEVDGAIATFSRAIYLNENDASAHNDLGDAYRQGEQYEKAQRSFEKALGLRVDYSAAHFNLGLTYGALGSQKAAAVHFREYVRLQPKASDRAQVEIWIQELDSESSESNN